MENKEKFFWINVAGWRYENSDGSSRIKYLLGLTDTDKLKLIREPDNSYDQYVIKVVYGNDLQIGYIPMDYSKLISGYLDANCKYDIPRYKIERGDVGYNISCGIKLKIFI